MKMVWGSAKICCYNKAFIESYLMDIKKINQEEFYIKQCHQTFRI